MNNYKPCNKFNNVINQDGRFGSNASNSNGHVEVNECHKCGETGDLSIVRAFKDLYEDKMKIIDKEAGGDTVVQAKIKLQQDWIRDLTDQNEMLVRVVEELEQEATQRVNTLEDKLKTSSQCACEVMNKYRDISVNLDKTFQNMEQMQNDIKSLIEFVRRIRDDGVWTVSGLKFYHVHPEDLIGQKEENMVERHIECSKSPKGDQTIESIRLKDARISELESKLNEFLSEGLSPNEAKELRQSMLDMRDSLTAEVADKHDMVLALRRDLSLLEEQLRKADQQTHFKDDIIKELRREIKQLKLEKNSYAQTINVESEWEQKRRTSKELVQELTDRCNGYKDKSQRMCYTQTDQKNVNIYKKESLNKLKKKPSIRQFLSDLNIINSCQDASTSTTSLTGAGWNNVNVEIDPDILTRGNLADVHDYMQNSYDLENEGYIRNKLFKYEQEAEKELGSWIYNNSLVGLNEGTPADNIQKHLNYSNKTERDNVSVKSPQSVEVPSNFEKEAVMELFENTKKEIIEAIRNSITTDNNYQPLKPVGSFHSLIIDSDGMRSSEKNKAFQEAKIKHSKQTKGAYDKMLLHNKSLKNSNETTSKTSSPTSSPKSTSTPRKQIAKLKNKNLMPKRHTSLVSNGPKKISTANNTVTTNYVLNNKPIFNTDPVFSGDEKSTSSRTGSIGTTTNSQKKRYGTNSLQHQKKIFKVNATNGNSVRKSKNINRPNWIRTIIIDKDKSNKNKSKSLNLDSSPHGRSLALDNKLNATKKNNDIRKLNNVIDINIQTNDTSSLSEDETITNNASIGYSQTDTEIRKNYMYTTINRNPLNEAMATTFLKNNAMNYFFTAVSPVNVYTSTETDMGYRLDASKTSNSSDITTDNDESGAVTMSKSEENARSHEDLMIKYLKSLDKIESLVKQMATDQILMLAMQKQIDTLVEDLYNRDKQLMDMNDLKQHDGQDRLKELEEENDMLRRAIAKAKKELDELEARADDYLADRDSYKERHRKSQELVDEFVQDKIKSDLQSKNKHDELRNSISSLQSQVSDLEIEASANRNNVHRLEATKADYEQKFEDNKKEVAQLKDEIISQKASYSTIEASILEYKQLIVDSNGKITSLQTQLFQSQSFITQHESTIREYEKKIRDSQDTISVLEEELVKTKREYERSLDSISEMSQAVSTKDKKSVNIIPEATHTYSSGTDVKDAKQSNNESKAKRSKEMPHETTDSAPDVNNANKSNDGSPKSYKNNTELDEVISNLSESVSRMMVKHSSKQSEKQSKMNMEDELAAIRNKDEIIKIQNDTLNIIQIELQALKNKDKEVEEERNKRHQEISNLKLTIVQLEKSLKACRDQAASLQKSVDLYLNAVTVLETSEERNKLEISQQRISITNLRDALEMTKQQLHEYQQKNQNDLCEKYYLIQELWNKLIESDNKLMSNSEQMQFQQLYDTIEDLRDLNLELEVDLFYNTQDVEMLDSRLLKYQQDFTAKENACGCLEAEIRKLQEEKRDRDDLIEDLRVELAQCSADLLNLQNILLQEQAIMEQECSTLTASIIDLQSTIHDLQTQLIQSQKDMKRELKINDINATRIEELQSTNADKTLEIDRWTVAANDLKQKLDCCSQQSKKQLCAINVLHEQLRNFEIANTIRDEHTDICQEEVSVCLNSLDCFKNKLYLVTTKLTKRNEEFNNLQARCCVQENELVNLKQSLAAAQATQTRESQQYKTCIREQKEKIARMECQCQKLNDEIHQAQTRMLETMQKDNKMQKTSKERELTLNEKLEQVETEGMRLLDVVAELEQQVAMLNCELEQKHISLENVKKELKESHRKSNDEKTALKNEINCIIQKQNILKMENEKLQNQLQKFRSNMIKNDERNSMITEQLDQCLCELQTLHADKEHLSLRNDELTSEIQQLQDAFQMKSNSVVTLEMELTDTRCSRDILCTESKNVVHNVKAWLQEQRRINKQLESKIQNKNNALQVLQKDNNELKRDKSILEDTVRNLVHKGPQTAAQKCANPSCASMRSRQRGGQFHSSKTQSPTNSNRALWSIGSDSPPSSLISHESEYEDYSASEQDEHDIYNDDTPEVWVHRVESLTDELQKSSRYWKSKLHENDLIVSKDK